MNNTMKMDVITSIDEDIIDTGLRFREEQIKKTTTKNMRKRITWKHIAVMAACLALLICAAGLIYNSHVKKSGGYIEDYQIAPTPATYIGTKITQEEIDYQIEINETMTIEYLEELYGTDDYTISHKGYYHVSLEKDGNHINYNYIRLPIYNSNGEIVGTVVLFRSGDELLYQIDTGGAWFERLNAVLSEYPDQDILMLYIGDFVELVMTPDNKVHYLTGSVDNEFISGVDYYDLFYGADVAINSSDFSK